MNARWQSYGRHLRTCSLQSTFHPPHEVQRVTRAKARECGRMTEMTTAGGEPNYAHGTYCRKTVGRNSNSARSSVHCPTNTTAHEFCRTSNTRRTTPIRGRFDLNHRHRSVWPLWSPIQNQCVRSNLATVGFLLFGRPACCGCFLPFLFDLCPRASLCLSCAVVVC